MIVTTACSDTQTTSQNATPNILADIQKICTLVPKHYAYFSAREAHWGEACNVAIADAESLAGTKEALAVMERLIDDLYDPHISLNANTQDSPRLLPSGADLWFEKTSDDFIVRAIRPESGAAATDIKIGDILVSHNGKSPNALAASRIHTGKNNVSPARYNWAVNAATAGRRSEDRELVLRRGEIVTMYKLDNPEPPEPSELVTSSHLASDIGYIRVNNSLGNIDTVPAFHRALESLQYTQGLILDLRDTPSGGGTDIAEPILGRFISTKMAYQRIIPQKDKTWTREVSPEGPWHYNKPLVVLVGRWTGSMGEGMAIGFDAMGRATIMGDHMAGLAGGIEGFKLDETNLFINFPTYDLHHLDGTPRHDWAPNPIVTADNGAQADKLLADAVILIQAP